MSKHNRQRRKARKPGAVPCAGCGVGIPLAVVRLAERVGRLTGVPQWHHCEHCKTFQQFEGGRFRRATAAELFRMWVEVPDQMEKILNLESPPGSTTLII